MDHKDIRHLRKGESVASGLIAAILIHSALIITLLVSGLKYLDPPPPEETFVIDFSAEPQPAPVRPPKVAQTRPQSVKPDRSRQDELVQSSQAQHQGTKPNLAQEATVGDQGDVEVNEPQREKPIDNRALFHAANNNSDKDTLAPQTSNKVEDKLREGHPLGNTKYGKVDGDPNGVKGRHITNGDLPLPEYPVQESGIVVVSVKVNQYGKVVEAKAGAPGTTTTNSQLWAAARTAAKKTVFNQAADAPVIQEGTITYVFNLK